MSETALQRAILDALEAIPGVLAVRVQSGGYRGRMQLARKGTADILACAHGKFVALEVKLPGSGPSLEQVAFLARVRDCGGAAVIVRSVAEAVAAVSQQ